MSRWDVCSVWWVRGLWVASHVPRWLGGLLLMLDDVLVFSFVTLLLYHTTSCVSAVDITFLFDYRERTNKNIFLKQKMLRTPRIMPLLLLLARITQTGDSGVRLGSQHPRIRRQKTTRQCRQRIEVFQYHSGEYAPYFE